MSTATRAGALFFTLALTVTAACGLKPGVEPVYVGGAQPGTGAGVPGTTIGPDGKPLPDGGSGPKLGPGGALPSAGSGSFSGGGGGPAAGGGTGTTVAGTGGGTADGAGGGAGGDPGAASGGRGGRGASGPVWGDVIKIGVHAPVTGAAAIPQESFRRGIGVYFDYVNRNGGIHGRKVEVLFEDDKFDPNTAVTKCKMLAEQEHVFLLIGAAGSDQIDACARYAASVGVPYLSAGVHQTRPGLGPLGNLRTYFAMALTYEQQAPLVARRAARFRGANVGLIVASNDSLNSYFGVQKSALRRAGVRLAYEARIPKDASGAEATTYATAICQERLRAVAWNASPSVLLNVVKQMPCTGVTFIGPGLTNGLNVVAEVGCPQLQGAQFYSPFPGMDVMRRDAQFVNAYRQRNGSEPDDIGASAWGMEKLVGSMLEASGKRLTRQRFMATIASVRQFNTGVYPPTNFGSRFGGTAMHRLVADCGRREYVTAAMNERP